MWHQLTQVQSTAGTSGTLTNVDIPAGARIICITAHCTSAGSVSGFPNGTGTGTLTIPIPASSWWVYDPKHLSKIVPNNFSLVFTSTDSYFIEWSLGGT